MRASIRRSDQGWLRQFRWCLRARRGGLFAVPTTLVLTFPWGCYHVTPWGRHVNEGVVELPPSPWRLLRATRRTHAAELDDVSREEPALGVPADHLRRAGGGAGRAGALSHFGLGLFVPER